MDKFTYSPSPFHISRACISTIIGRTLFFNGNFHITYTSGLNTIICHPRKVRQKIHFHFAKMVPPTQGITILASFWQYSILKLMFISVFCIDYSLLGTTETDVVSSPSQGHLWAENTVYHTKYHIDYSLTGTHVVLTFAAVLLFTSAIFKIYSLVNNI